MSESPHTLSSEELDAIRERAERATPPPWLIDSSSFGGIRAEIYRNRQCKAEPNVYFAILPAICNVMAWPQDRWDFLGPEESKANRNFIGHARTDIPKLLAEINHQTRQRADAEVRCVKLSAEVERLNTENATIQKQERQRCLSVLRKLFAEEEEVVRQISSKGNNAMMDVLQEAIDEISAPDA